jgi:chromosome segregation ATPase
LEVEHSNKYSSEAMNLNNEKTLLETKIRNKKQELTELNLKVEQDQKRREELYKQWDEVTKLKLEFDPNSFICPTCKREYETDKIEEMKKEFENNLNTHKESKKQAINAEGTSIKARLEENTAIIEKLKQEIPELTKQLEEKINRIEEIENKQTGSFDVTSLPEYQEKIKELEKLQEEINKLVNNDTTEIQNKKSNIMEQINNIDKQLNERDVQEKTKIRIKELENEEEELSQKVQELESQQYQTEEFTKTKVKLLENTINSNFELVKFRLFDTQINGGLKECCDTLVNGVPYSDVNNAHKIIAGLDIIKTLSRFYNTVAPIFIDNRE